jgi:hypothetical protein
MSQTFNFIPEEYISGQLADSKPEQKFEGEYDIIYECIQNSIDAKKNTDDKVSLKIHFKKVYKKDLPFLDENFKNHCQKSIKISDSRVLDDQQIDVMIMEDFSTTGITGDPEIQDDQTDTGKVNNYFYMNYSFGGNQKLDSFDQGGSEGEGRQTFCLNSDISTFFYYSVDASNNNKEAFFGISYLGKRKVNQQMYNPFAYFGNPKPNKKFKDITDVYPVTDSNTITDLVKKFKLKREKNQSGLSIIVPFYNIKFKKEKKLLISKILDVYRIPILRKKLELHIEEDIIDHSNLLATLVNGLNPDTEKDFKEKHKELCEEYFNFLNASNEVTTSNSYEINIYAGQKEIIKEDISNYDNLLKAFNNREICKVRINFSVRLIDHEANRASQNTIEKRTFVDFYINNYPGWADLSEKLNDFIRGPMSIYKLRKKNTQMFWLMDIQDEHASLLVKNAEQANHSDITANNKKLKRNYKNGYALIAFLKSFPSKFYNLIKNEENVIDNESTQDLFKIDSSGAGIRETDELSDQNDEESEGPVESSSSVSDIVIPPIFESLKYYEQDSKETDGKITFLLKGVKYKKDEIKNILTAAQNYIDSTSKIERSKYQDKELVKMDKKVSTFKRRIIEYKDFISNGCTFYPRRVEIEAAYDGEGISNPFRKYSKDDFDFSNDDFFSFNKNENVKIDSYNENKITLIAQSEDFHFKVTGFGDDQSEDVRWKYRSYSI